MPVYLTQHESSLLTKHYFEILSTETAGLFIKRSNQNQDPQQSSILLSKGREGLNYCNAAFCSSLSYSLHCPLLSETATNHFPQNQESRKFTSLDIHQAQAAHLVLSSWSAQLWGKVFNSRVSEG